MKKQLYSTPEIRVRGLEMEQLLDSNSITNINNGGSDGEEDLGYGGGGIGPAYAPKHSDMWEEYYDVWNE